MEISREHLDPVSFDAQKVGKLLCLPHMWRR